MKKFNTAPITDSAKYKVKKGTFEFLQQAYQEGFTAILRALIGTGYDPAVVYVLYGVVNSGTYPAYSVTEGVVFFGGEIYLVDAASFSATGSNVAVFSVITTQYTVNADPVTLTDTTIVNIHNVRKVLVAQGAAGSGIANLTQAFYLNFNIPQQLNLTATGVAVLTGAYPNLTLNVPTPPTNTFPILAVGNLNVGDVPVGTGTADFTVTFSTVGTSDYQVIGEIISNGSPVADTNVIWTTGTKTATSFIVHFRETAGIGQNISFNWALLKRS